MSENAEGRRNRGDDNKTAMRRRGLSSHLTLLFSKAWWGFFFFVIFFLPSAQSSFEINFSIKGSVH